MAPKPPKHQDPRTRLYLAFANCKRPHTKPIAGPDSCTRHDMTYSMSRVAPRPLQQDIQIRSICESIPVQPCTSEDNSDTSACTARTMTEARTLHPSIPKTENAAGPRSCIMDDPICTPDNTEPMALNSEQ
ncbi:hypothetical protein XPA_009924 [Xanthoria parietina]